MKKKLKCNHLKNEHFCHINFVAVSVFSFFGFAIKHYGKNVRITYHNNHHLTSSFQADNVDVIYNALWNEDEWQCFGVGKENKFSD
ncbi:CLUMA_CG014760, isoform A [Clunio marinus]|uniref:CLUMA_CG014760, isoform A n=1 Tax=Clunio marinus TaxID=568069 RepID=A0A1J1IL59_9DIPT|nr:CLUMA_CG014760, isoform A [Clunio marinus]